MWHERGIWQTLIFFYARNYVIEKYVFWRRVIVLECIGVYIAIGTYYYKTMKREVEFNGNIVRKKSNNK